MSWLEREEAWRKAVDKCYWDLTEHIDPDQVIKRLKTLLSRGNSDHNYQKVNLPNMTTQEGCEALLACLRRTENWWDPFIQALHHSGYDKYAEMLEDEHEKIVRTRFPNNCTRRKSFGHHDERVVDQETNVLPTCLSKVSSPQGQTDCQTVGHGSHSRQYSYRSQWTLDTPLKKTDYGVWHACLDLDNTSTKGNYRELAVELDLLYEDMITIEINQSPSHTHQVLELYIQRNPEQATIGRLMQALFKIQRKDVLSNISHMTQLALPEQTPIQEMSSNSYRVETSEPGMTNSSHQKVCLDFSAPDRRPSANSHLTSSQNTESQADESFQKQITCLDEATRLKEVDESDADKEDSESDSEEEEDTSMDEADSEESRTPTGTGHRGETSRATPQDGGERHRKRYMVDAKVNVQDRTPTGTGQEAQDGKEISRATPQDGGEGSRERSMGNPEENTQDRKTTWKSNSVKYFILSIKFIDETVNVNNILEWPPFQKM